MSGTREISSFRESALRNKLVQLLSRLLPRTFLWLSYWRCWFLFSLLFQSSAGYLNFLYIGIYRRMLFQYFSIILDTSRNENYRGRKVVGKGVSPFDILFYYLLYLHGSYSVGVKWGPIQPLCPDLFRQPCLATGNQYVLEIGTDLRQPTFYFPGLCHAHFLILVPALVILNYCNRFCSSHVA